MRPWNLMPIQRSSCTFVGDLMNFFGSFTFSWWYDAHGWISIRNETASPKELSELYLLIQSWSWHSVQRSLGGVQRLIKASLLLRSNCPWGSPCERREPGSGFCQMAATRGMNWGLVILVLKFINRYKYFDLNVTSLWWTEQSIKL